MFLSDQREKFQVFCMVRRQNETTAEEIARLQHLFPILSWLTSGRTFGHLLFIARKVT